ncbi:MAG TPA: hypothetical protein VF606_12100 [Geminicoccaceae bacterium]
MNLVELTEVPDAGLPLARLREHLRLGTGFPDDSLQDALLAGFLRAALAAIEGRTGKALLSRSFLLTLSAWRSPERQPLPAAPVSAIVSVTLTDATGAVTSIPLSALRLEEDAMRPCLLPVGGSLPTIPQAGAARIVLTAGYGPAWEDLPPDLAQAVLMLAAHYHEYRYDVAFDGGCMPFGVTALIERYRPLRLSGGLA